MSTGNPITNIANNGGKWIRPEKRLAIYLRDRLSCSWCGSKLTENSATLDHLKPQSKNGDNHERNLISACKTCNCGRGTRGISEFAEIVARYINHGETKETIMRRIRRRRRRKLSIKWAKALITLNRSFERIGMRYGWRERVCNE